MLHFYKTIPRLFYGNNDKILDPESLLDIQIKSYKKFIDFKIENSTKIFTSCNGIDKSLNEAINKAYRVVDLIDFKEKYFRTDIGKKAFKYYNKEEQ